MNEVILISCILIFLIILVMLWLIFENFKIKKSLATLTSLLEQNSNDIAGLCAAAVVVDKKLMEAEKKLNHLPEQLTDYECQGESAPPDQPRRVEDRYESVDFEDVIEQQEIESVESDVSEQQDNQPYYSAIQGVRDGATIDELMQQFGLSRDEAVLLSRLHGKS